MPDVSGSVFWAGVPRVVFATTCNGAGCGLEDLAIYEQVKLPAGCRSAFAPYRPGYQTG